MRGIAGSRRASVPSDTAEVPHGTPTAGHTNATGHGRGRLAHNWCRSSRRQRASNATAHAQHRSSTVNHRRRRREWASDGPRKRAPTTARWGNAGNASHPLHRSRAQREASAGRPDVSAARARRALARTINLGLNPGRSWSRRRRPVLERIRRLGRRRRACRRREPSSHQGREPTPLPTRLNAVTEAWVVVDFCWRAAPAHSGEVFTRQHFDTASPRQLETAPQASEAPSRGRPVPAQSRLSAIRAE